MWITVDDVIKFHGLKQQHLNFKEDTDSFEETIIEWIIQCQSMIIAYTHNKFIDGTVPEAVRNVCLRLVSNMITMAIQRRDSPLIRVNDWTVTTTSSNIFTDDLKEDLKPFIKEHSNISDRIDIFAITGE